MVDIQRAAEKLTTWLKQSKMQCLVCSSCGYSQGHPITYCPKCPGKMHYIVSSEYAYFLRIKSPKNNLWYKYHCTSLLGLDRLSMSEWQDIVEEIFKTKEEK
ncbi:hypothetical protein KA005_45810 [bacterium]|nr:hypothetical protein [bacterium]